MNLVLVDPDAQMMRLEFGGTGQPGGRRILGQDGNRVAVEMKDAR